ncbi:hypothetical protein SVAN01_07313 [Stagonosporopsis vannaccii]|nr:hypothetical protein SVAN01_07313 [Stagonosporopsis vannaccii]
MYSAVAGRFLEKLQIASAEIHSSFKPSVPRGFCDSRGFFHVCPSITTVGRILLHSDDPSTLAPRTGTSVPQFFPRRRQAPHAHSSPTRPSISISCSRHATSLRVTRRLAHE